MVSQYPAVKQFNALHLALGDYTMKSEVSKVTVWMFNNHISCNVEWNKRCRYFQWTCINDQIAPVWCSHLSEFNYSLTSSSGRTNNFT